MRSSLLIPLAAAAGLALSVPTMVSTAQADGRANRPDVISVKDIKKGMKGYGLTVFEGTQPERFGVEVIDVLHNFRPRQELILVKTDHPRLDVAKIVGGMSGSPIYFNGRMAGAYAYGWTFGVEPVAGVTPIRAMLDDLERPLPKILHGYPLGPAPSKSKKSKKLAYQPGRFSGDITDYSMDEHGQQMAERMARDRGQWVPSDAAGATKNPKPAPSLMSQLTPVTTPIFLGGMTAETAQLASQYFEPLGLMPVQGGGTGTSKSHKPNGKFVDGGAIGVGLVRGDVSAMGLGTVTRVEGDKLVAFGHPMMGVGVTNMPTTEARVLWFMASQMRSFKMGEGIAPLGSLVNDRQASIVVDQTVKAPTLEASLHVQGEPGAPYRDWNFTVAHERFMTPSLLALAVGNALNAAAAERRDVTWSMTTKIEFDKYPGIEIEDIGSSSVGVPVGPQVMRTQGMKAVGMVINNPWEDVRVTKVDVTMRITFGREVAGLRGIQLLTKEVEPGGNARLKFTLEPFNGERFTKIMSVPIPKEFAGQSVSLRIQPGYLVQKVRAAPESLPEMISNLEAGTEEPRSVVFSYATGEGSAAFRGVVAENLPPGAMDRLSSSSSSISPQKFQTMHHHVVKTPLYMIGRDMVTVRVKSGRK